MKHTIIIAAALLTGCASFTEPAFGPGDFDSPTDWAMWAARAEYAHVPDNCLLVARAAKTRLAHWGVDSEIVVATRINHAVLCIDAQCYDNGELGGAFPRSELERYL